MKTTMTVELSAKEVTEILVPAAKERIDPSDTLGKLVKANAEEAGGLAVKVNLSFDTEAK